MRPRCIQLTRRVKPLKALCTDASWEPHSIAAPGLGAVLLGELCRPAIGLAAVVPGEVLANFLPRKTQIAPLEALACLQAFDHLASELAGHDVLVFIDNTSACNAVVKGGSTASDIFFLACTAHVLWNFLQCRVYVEYIPSEANPSDGVSRDGAMDQWTPSPYSLPHVPPGTISVLMVW